MRTISALLTPIANLRPSQLSLWIVVGIFFFAISLGIYDALTEKRDIHWASQLNSALLFVFFGFTLFLCYDLLLGLPIEQITCQRLLPASFSLNKPQAVRFELTNTSDIELDVIFHDSHPSHFYSGQFPLKQKIKPGQKAVFEYQVIPKIRGLAEFSQAYVIFDSRFGLWQFTKRMGNDDRIKVYPDFSAISDSFILGVDQAMRHMGAHIAKRKGDGMEFNQLREFRVGDTLKQIDWKATARLGEPISKEYQEEKDQNVIFLLDCSRRMRALENDLSYFDYALNALLMSSYIALDKGDAVGVMTFSGEPTWLPPIKGKRAINTILNHLYDLHTSTQSSDFVTAAEQLLIKQRKRSLVILLTNVRDEDNEDLQKAVQILQDQHIVMVVALQEVLLKDINKLDLSRPDQAMLFAGTKLFQQQRNKMLAYLKAIGVSVVDATHENIHIQVVTEYLRLKHSGKI